MLRFALRMRLIPVEIDSILPPHGAPVEAPKNDPWGLAVSLVFQ